MINGMTNIQEIGWDPETLGELDHQKVCAPYVRLTSYVLGEKGDVIYTYDLRMTQPNKTFLTTKVLHSLEHLLLAGFRKYMPEKFICVAPMGCQTGFYLVLLNEGDAEKVITSYSTILEEIISMDSVPYANIEDCGQYLHHDLMEAKKFSEKLLTQKQKWRSVF